MAHVAQWKKDYVEMLYNGVTGKKVVGLVMVNGIPATQINEMRKKLREEKIFFKVSKKTLLRLLIDRLNDNFPGIEKLKDHIDGQVGIVAGDVNPFRLFKELKATMMPVPAKGGEIAPDDIWVRKGETPFKPGPIISELASAGIPAAIDKGKVVIKTDKLLVKKGEVISKEAAFGLTKLEIYPLQVGMIPLAIYEDGIVFLPKDLDIDMDAFVDNIATAHSRALNLALNIGYPTAATMEMLITKAHMDAKALAIGAGIVTPETAPEVIARAHAQMLALSRMLGDDALDDELKGLRSATAVATQAAAQPTEEKKEEEKKDEEEEEEEVSEEEAAAGLGALFG